MNRRAFIGALGASVFGQSQIVAVISATGSTLEGVVGGLIGIHWSLGISAMTLLAVTIVLFAFTIPGRRSEEAA